jgi:hypothetical protein
MRISKRQGLEVPSSRQARTVRRATAHVCHLAISDEEALPGRDWQQLGYEAAEPLGGFDTKFKPEELSIARELSKSL